MKVEENWHDAGVFFATLKMQSSKKNTSSEISRVFAFKNCFSRKEAIHIILKKFPNVLAVTHIDYFENCHMLKDF